MTKEPSVAIIVLNWNGFHDTVDCLRSVYASGYANYRVILVDNGSSAGEAERLHELFPETCLIRNSENKGFAGGNNDGISLALQKGFDYIVNLNNDCLVEQDWLERLVAGINSAGADFASSCIMYYPETGLICSDENALLPDGTGISVNHLKQPAQSRAARLIFSACGAASIYSATCLQAVKIRDAQFFDELYFAYLEDVDLGIRLNALGFRGVSIPDAVVYHKETQTSGDRSFFHIFHLEKNRMLNELLNYPVWLIPAGELFFCLRTFANTARRIFHKKKSRAIPAERSIEEGRPFSAALKARVWIVLHMPEILRDRRERRRRGLLNRKIYNNFFWKY